MLDNSIYGTCTCGLHGRMYNCTCICTYTTKNLLLNNNNCEILVLNVLDDSVTIAN